MRPFKKTGWSTYSIQMQPFTSLKVSTHFTSVIREELWFRSTWVSFWKLWWLILLFKTTVYSLENNWNLGGWWHCWKKLKKSSNRATNTSAQTIRQVVKKFDWFGRLATFCILCLTIRHHQFDHLLALVVGEYVIKPIAGALTISWNKPQFSFNNENLHFYHLWTCLADSVGCGSTVSCCGIASPWTIRDTSVRWNQIQHTGQTVSIITVITVCSAGHSENDSVTLSGCV